MGGADELTVVWTPPTIPNHKAPCNGTVAKKGLCPGGVADGGARIMTYIVQRDTSPTFASSNSRVKTIEAFDHQKMYTAVFGGSESYTTYYVRVFATNSQGTGKQSKVLTIKTGDVESGSPIVSTEVVFTADCKGPTSKEALFLKECSAKLAPLRCTELKCGSVIVTLRGRSIYMTAQLKTLKSEGLKLPSFEAMKFKQAGAPKATGTTKAPAASGAKTTKAPAAGAKTPKTPTKTGDAKSGK